MWRSAELTACAVSAAREKRDDNPEMTEPLISDSKPGSGDDCASSPQSSTDCLHCGSLVIPWFAFYLTPPRNCLLCICSRQTTFLKQPLSPFLRMLYIHWYLLPPILPTQGHIWVYLSHRNRMWSKGFYFTGIHEILSDPKQWWKRGYWVEEIDSEGCGISAL